jgi:general secretion pathway protein G
MPHSRGFTLIELLVVIAIIGILSAVVLASLNGARKKGRDARRISDLKQIQLALEMYYDFSGTNEYPEEVSNGVPSAALAPAYISTAPTDPQTGAAYPYNNLTAASAACAASSAVCPNYVLGATLEDNGATVLTNDIDGTVGSINCADTSGAPVYCLMP